MLNRQGLAAIGMALFLAAFTLATGAARAADRTLEESIFRVGTKSYTLTDIAGRNEESFLKECREILKPISLEDLIKDRLTEDQRKNVLALPETKRREAVEKLLCRKHLNGLIRHTFGIALHAGITDRIVAEHGIDLDDYYKVETVRGCLRKLRQYYKYLGDSLRDPATDERVLNEMNRTMGINWDKASWLKSRNSVRSYSPFARWSSEFGARSPHYEELSWKASLAHALLRNACKEGIYGKQATELAVVRWSSFMAYEFTNYNGERGHLEAFVQAAFKDGEIDNERVKELAEVLRKTTPACRFAGRFVTGGKLIDGVTAPPIGRLIDIESGHYVVYSWLSRRSPDKVDDVDIVNFAFPLAGLDYYPDVYVHAKDIYAGDPTQELRFLTSDGVAMQAAEMSTLDYVKKPYPAEPFARNREARKVVENAVFRAMTAHVKGDKEAASAVVAELRLAAEKPGPKFLQQQYRRAADGLAQQLKLGPNPKKP